jgi:hypothetical protein
VTTVQLFNQQRHTTQGTKPTTGVRHAMGQRLKDGPMVSPSVGEEQAEQPMAGERKNATDQMVSYYPLVI